MAHSTSLVFHVKQLLHMFNVSGVGIALCLLAAGPVGADVYKCTGLDGRVVFSDQACLADQTTRSVRGVVASSPASAGGREPGQLSYEGSVQREQRAQVHAALTPECRVLGDTASRALQSDASSMDEVKRAVAQFESQCGDQVQKASARVHATRAVPDASSCHRLRQSVLERRGRLKTMTNLELQEFAKFQNEVSVGCR